MKREEEIEQAIRENCLSSVSVIFFKMGAEWADAHQPQVAYLEHEIERLKSKLQAADDFNTLLVYELEKAKSPWISVETSLPKPLEPYKEFSKNCIVLYIDQKTVTSYCTEAYYDFKSRAWVLTNGDNEHFFYSDYEKEGYLITHWMPIPELQKGCEK